MSGVPQGSIRGPLLFHIFVNDLPDWIKTNICMFADDTKIWTRITSIKDTAELRFNPDEFKVMHVGHQHKPNYMIHQDNTDWNIQEVTEDSDLGVLTTCTLKVSRQFHEAASKANRVLGMIHRQFKDLDKKSFLIIYNSFVRPHLEYAVQSWSPYLKWDMEHLEKVQRRATKLVKGYWKLPYEELQRLNLTTLHIVSTTTRRSNRSI